MSRRAGTETAVSKSSGRELGEWSKEEVVPVATRGDSEGKS
jgi:hypothetical protein